MEDSAVLRNVQDTAGDKVLGETKSLCPFCLKPLPAQIIEKEGKVFLVRNCPEHGKYAQLISEHPEYYRKLRDYYFAVVKGDIKQTRYLLFITGECNLGCPICFYGGKRFGGLSASEVKD